MPEFAAFDNAEARDVRWSHHDLKLRARVIAGGAERARVAGVVQRYNAGKNEAALIRFAWLEGPGWHIRPRRTAGERARFAEVVRLKNLCSIALLNVQLDEIIRRPTNPRLPLEDQTAVGAHRLGGIEIPEVRHGRVSVSRQDQGNRRGTLRNGFHTEIVSSVRISRIK